MSTRIIDGSMAADLEEVERRNRPPPTANAFRRFLLRRVVLMVIAFILYSVVEILAKVMIVIHCMIAMASGRPSPRLLEAGARLSVFISQLWRYLLFCREAPPWPLDRLAQWQIGK